jgi:hypothetical protein
MGRGLGRAGSCPGAALLVTGVLQLVLTPAAAFTSAPSVAQLCLRHKHGDLRERRRIIGIKECSRGSRGLAGCHSCDREMLKYEP